MIEIGQDETFYVVLGFFGLFFSKTGQESSP